MTTSTAMFSKRAAFILCFVIVGLCYLNSLPNDLVFDDGPIVGSNPAIRSISPIQFLKSPYWAQKQYEGIYRPLTIFSLSVDYAIWKKWLTISVLSNPQRAQSSAKPFLQYLTIPVAAVMMTVFRALPGRISLSIVAGGVLLLLLHRWMRSQVE